MSISLTHVHVHAFIPCECARVCVCVCLGRKTVLKPERAIVSQKNLKEAKELITDDM